MMCLLNGFELIFGTSFQEMVLDNNIPEQTSINKVFERENFTNIDMVYYLSQKFPKICIICVTSISREPDNKIKFPVLEL